MHVGGRKHRHERALYVPFDGSRAKINSNDDIQKQNSLVNLWISSLINERSKVSYLAPGYLNFINS